MRGRRTLFLSHAWQHDALGRDTHARVLALARGLRKHGWTVWVDEHQPLHGQLLSHFARGIQESDAVLVCLTTPYCHKIESAFSHPSAVLDACARELLLATLLRKPIVPVCLEAQLRTPACWGSMLSMQLGNHMYADVSEDAVDSLPVHRILCGLFSITTTTRRLAAIHRPPVSIRL